MTRFCVVASDHHNEGAGAPPTQALEFQHTLLERGVEAALVTYPVYLDSAARIVAWFERHLGGAN